MAKIRNNPFSFPAEDGVNDVSPIALVTQHSAMSDLGLWPRLWMAWVALGCAAGTAKGSNPLLAKFLPGHEGDDGPYLELRSDSPAVLDAPLTIYATLKNEDASNAPFFFSFSKSIKSGRPEAT